MTLLGSRTILDHSSRRIVPFGKEERSKALAGINQAAAPDQVRSYLAAGQRPPDSLLDAETLSAALNLDDCWKYARNLSITRRTIEAAALLKAVQVRMHSESKPNPRKCGKGLLSIAKMWRGGKTFSVPSESTAIGFLAAVNDLLNLGDGGAKKKRNNLGIPETILRDLIRAADQLILLYPTVPILLQLTYIVTNAINRHHFDYDFVDESLASDTRIVDVAWQKLKDELAITIAAIKLDDMRMLLRAMRTVPGKYREFRSIVNDHLKTGAEIEAGCRILLSEYVDVGEEYAQRLETPPDMQKDLEDTELARVVMRAWDFSNGAASRSELAQEVSETIGRLFNLRMFGEIGEIARYQPSLHEFEPACDVADDVVVVRPGIMKIMPSRSNVIFKAVVKGKRESPHAEHMVDRN